MSAADIVIVLLLFGFALGGLRRGIVWELATTIGLVIGFVLVWSFRREILSIVVRLSPPGWPQQWVGGFAFLICFLVVYIGFAAIGHRLHEGLGKTFLKWPDHILGIAAGLLKGAVLIGVFVLVTDGLEGTGRIRAFIYQSEIVRWGRRAADRVIHWESPEKRKWVDQIVGSNDGTEWNG
jgi:uncharacterized membrane protein required for colicin V production